MLRYLHKRQRIRIQKSCWTLHCIYAVCQVRYGTVCGCPSTRLKIAPWSSITRWGSLNSRGTSLNSRDVSPNPRGTSLKFRQARALLTATSIQPQKFFLKKLVSSGEYKSLDTSLKQGEMPK